MHPNSETHLILIDIDIINNIIAKIYTNKFTGRQSITIEELKEKIITERTTSEIPRGISCQKIKIVLQKNENLKNPKIFLSCQRLKGYVIMQAYLAGANKLIFGIADLLEYPMKMVGLGVNEMTSVLIFCDYADYLYIYKIINYGERETGLATLSAAKLEGYGKIISFGAVSANNSQYFYFSQVFTSRVEFKLIEYLEDLDCVSLIPLSWLKPLSYQQEKIRCNEQTTKPNINCILWNKGPIIKNFYLELNNETKTIQIINQRDFVLYKNSEVEYINIFENYATVITDRILSLEDKALGLSCGRNIHMLFLEDLVGEQSTLILDTKEIQKLQIGHSFFVSPISLLGNKFLSNSFHIYIIEKNNYQERIIKVGRRILEVGNLDKKEFDSHSLGIKGNDEIELLLSFSDLFDYEQKIPEDDSRPKKTKPVIFLFIR